MDPQSNSNLFYSSQPNIKIPTAPTSNYATNFNMSAPMSQILAKMGSALKPMNAYTQQNPYDKFAAPYRATLSNWESTFARPEFQKFTANPWEQNYANTLATGGGQMGGAIQRYTNAQNQMWQPYYNQVQNAQSQLEDTIRNFYNQGITNNYTGPTAFRSA